MKRGLSIIEMLIAVVLLAAVIFSALPAYRQAEGRSKVSEARQNLQILGAAIEAYGVDQGAYPFDWDSRGWSWYMTDVLSTPVAYVSRVDELLDPFRYRYYRYPLGMRYVNYPANMAPDPWPPSPIPGPYFDRWFATTGYSKDIINQGMENYGFWRLSSAGPDETASIHFLTNLIKYDPTNGVFSQGDIVYSQRYQGSE